MMKKFFSLLVLALALVAFGCNKEGTDTGTDTGTTGGEAVDADDATGTDADDPDATDADAGTDAAQ